MSLDNSAPASDARAAAIPDERQPAANSADRRDQLRKLTDPKAMRAIAHPTRLSLLDLLSRHDQLTATEAAELVGESPTNCAFHLRTLAKYGFVEEAGEAPGRRRPWRRAHLGFSFDDTGQADDDTGQADTGQAAQLLADLLWDGWLRRLQQVRNTRHRFDRRWREVTSGSQYLGYLTPAEAAEFNEQLQQLFDRHRERLGHPDRRPEHALAVEYLLFSFPQQAAEPPSGAAVALPSGGALEAVAPPGGEPAGTP
ncbi:MAG: helix-turn-helix domain-containing protein [Jatrophihabitantaceae bacterium]